MNKLPNMIQGLLEKYGPCKIVRHKYDVPPNQLRTDMKAFHGVCVVVRTKEGKFVLIRHRFVLPGAGPDIWALPCGKVEENESLEEAAVRETLEETGLNVQITGLYRIFQFIQTSSGKSRTESYVAVFFGEVLSEVQHFESPETLEVRKFKKLPTNFAGELRKYYEDLM